MSSREERERAALRLLGWAHDLADTRDDLRRGGTGNEPGKEFDERITWLCDAAALLRETESPAPSEGLDDARSAYMNARTCVCGEDASRHPCPSEGPWDEDARGFDPDWPVIRAYFERAQNGPAPSEPVAWMVEVYVPEQGGWVGGGEEPFYGDEEEAGKVARMYRAAPHKIPARVIPLYRRALTAPSEAGRSNGVADEERERKLAALANHVRIISTAIQGCNWKEAREAAGSALFALESNHRRAIASLLRGSAVQAEERSAANSAPKHRRFDTILKELIEAMILDAAESASSDYVGYALRKSELSEELKACVDTLYHSEQWK